MARESRTGGGNAGGPLALALVYAELTKARLTALVVATALVGFLVASHGPPDIARLLWTVLGTALAAGGANALNQRIEIDRDRRMTRTRNRPFPANRIGMRHGLVFGLAVTIAGPAILALRVNLLTAALGLAAAAIYVLVYTPMKTHSPLCTLVGAVVGAIPPMMGWTAAAGSIGGGAWILSGILFAWQIPHFLALAWLYRDEYAKAGYRMLPVMDAKGTVTFRMTLLYSLVLIPVTLALTLAGKTGPVYAAGAFFLGAALLVQGARLYRSGGESDARRLFLASVIYLPLLLGLMVADRGDAGRFPAPVRAEAAPAALEEAPEKTTIEPESPLDESNRRE